MESTDIYKTENMAALLTDANKKDEKGNFFKLFDVFQSELHKLYETQEMVRQFRSVDEAEGKTLDLIGKNFKTNRANMSDDLYRPTIKSAISRSWCDGSFNSVLKLLALTLNTDVKNVALVEDYEIGGSAAMVSIKNTPNNELNSIGMTIERYCDIVQNLLPIGIGLTITAFDGSFAYAKKNYVDGSEYTPELDAESGFADDEQTTGGTLSGIITEL